MLAIKQHDGSSRKKIHTIKLSVFVRQNDFAKDLINKHNIEGKFLHNNSFQLALGSTLDTLHRRSFLDLASMSIEELI